MSKGLPTCPSCGANAAKERIGTLGESKGVWCTACGFDLPSIDAWQTAHREEPGHVWGQPKPEPEPAPKQSSITKLFHSRKHGPLQHSFPGLDLLPLVDVDAIPDDKLGVALHYLYGEVWTDASSAQQKRDRLRSLVT